MQKFDDEILPLLLKSLCRLYVTDIWPIEKIRKLISDLWAIISHPSLFYTLPPFSPTLCPPILFVREEEKSRPPTIPFPS
jgi:hypothetical protein